MTRTEQLQILKQDLGIMTNAIDERLLQLLESSSGFIADEGIKLTDSAADSELVIMYASYLWRKRKDDNPVMPRSLRWALNNRLFSQKAGASDV